MRALPLFICPFMKLILSSLFLLNAYYASAQWTLLWEDEFNTGVLDTNYWTSDIGGFGWGNNEWQYYTDGDNLDFTAESLLIEAREEQVGGNNYTSGKIITKGKFDIRYGKVEARIKVPMGQGLWPAFWMLGANIDQVSWPQCGEIDIMEHINLENQIHGTMHWNAGGHVYYGGSTSLDPSEFQVYTIEWDSAEIRWYANGIQYHTANILNGVNDTEEFTAGPFYLILNLAVGGNWPGYPNASTPFPSQLEIDYVRVYKRDWEIGIEEASSLDVSVFPNPSDGLVQLQGEYLQAVQLYSLTGQLMHDESVEAQRATLDVSHLPSGVYLLHCFDEAGRRKVIRLMLH